MGTTSKDEDQCPPAYTKNTMPDAVSPPTPPIHASSSTPTFSLAPPTNFLTIIRDNGGIKGGYIIDPSMPMPPGAVPSIGDDGKPLNMCIVSKYGSVDLVVELVHKDDTNGPALLAVDSPYSSVKIAVHDKTPTHFRLKVMSKYGAVVARIPSTFVGAISTWLKYGKLTFSPTVKTRLATTMETDREGRYFIGDYAASGYKDDESWLGDHLHVHAEHGKVRIEFVDEESEASSPGTGSSHKKSLFRRFLS